MTISDLKIRSRIFLLGGIYAPTMAQARLMFARSRTYARKAYELENRKAKA